MDRVYTVHVVQGHNDEGTVYEGRTILYEAFTETEVVARSLFVVKVLRTAGILYM